MTINDAVLSNLTINTIYRVKFSVLQRVPEFIRVIGGNQLEYVNEDGSVSYKTIPIDNPLAVVWIITL